MPAVTLVVFAFVMDDFDLGRIGIDAAYLVGDDGVGFPRIPKLIADLHILIEPLVAPGAIGHGVAVSVPLALRIGRDDVPGDAAVRQMVEAREPAAHRIRMLEGRRQCDADTEVFGRRRNDRNNGRGFVRRALHRPLHDGIGAVLVRVIRSELIGDEHPVEQSALHRSRHVLPIFGPREVPPDFVLRVTPHSGCVTVHAVLDETQKMCAFLVLLLHKSTPIRPRPIGGVRRLRLSAQTRWSDACCRPKMRRQRRSR
jgi:hypothetical protein